MKQHMGVTKTFFFVSFGQNLVKVFYIAAFLHEVCLAAHCQIKGEP